jgi:hypothetical protein
VVVEAAYRAYLVEVVEVRVLQGPHLQALGAAEEVVEEHR